MFFRSTYTFTKLDPILASFSIFYHLEISKNFWFFGVLRAYKMGTLAKTGLKKLTKNLPMIGNGVHVFNSLLFSSKN